MFVQSSHLLNAQKVSNGWTCVCGHPAASDENTGDLKLSNLSSNMSGMYVCTASNTAGSETCSITLDIINST